MIILFAAAAVLVATAGTTPTDDHQLVAVTVDAVRGCRKLSIFEFTIYRGYAVGGWQCGEGGGSILAAKWEGRWARLTASGGALEVPTLERYSVPSDIARILVAPCPPGHSHALSGPHVASNAKVCTP
jgi:hypothetical protein